MQLSLTPQGHAPPSTEAEPSITPARWGSHTVRLWHDWHPVGCVRPLREYTGLLVYRREKFFSTSPLSQSVLSVWGLEVSLFRLTKQFQCRRRRRRGRGKPGARTLTVYIFSAESCAASCGTDTTARRFLKLSRQTHISKVIFLAGLSSWRGLLCRLLWGLQKSSRRLKKEGEKVLLGLSDTAGRESEGKKPSVGSSAFIMEVQGDFYV